MNHFETSWNTSDGVAIYAQGWEPEQRRPSAAVCLVHGIGEHTGRYAHVAKHFCEQGYALFGPDHRGHGRSEGPRGHFPSAAALEQDMDLHLAEARKRYPGIPLFLYGHSLGGIFVLYYALTRKPEVSGIIATSPGLETALQKQPIKVLASRILGLLVPRLSLASGLDPSAISRDEEVVRAYTGDPLVHDRITLGSGRTLLGVIRRTMDHAPGFSLPLLLMHGSEDTIAFPSGSLNFARSLTHPHRLIIRKGSFHELHNEPDRETHFSEMTGWIGDLISRRPADN